MHKAIKRYTPWWLKIIFKLVFSKLGLPYDLWRKIGIFRHGSMLDPEYAISVFERHYQPCVEYLPDKFSVLELGPGDSLATALIAANRGASKIILVDHGKFASLEINDYLLFYNHLGLRADKSIEDLLNKTNAEYHVEGLESLKNIPTNSVDFIFSQAVLEHIYLDEFEGTIRELFRIQKPGGVSSHRIDFKDHLKNSLNSLRFSRHLWEAEWFANSGFYTNRLRESQVTDQFVNAGYEIIQKETANWDDFPIPRGKLHLEFEHLSEKDLLTTSLDLITRKSN
jgi:SAM-dependent methyltransferase